MFRFQFDMDQKVTDKVSGFTGVVTARAEYSHEPSCYRVTSKDETGKEEWYLEGRLKKAD